MDSGNDAPVPVPAGVRLQGLTAYRWALLVVVAGACLFAGIAIRQAHQSVEAQAHRELVETATRVAVRTELRLAAIDAALAAVRETPCVRTRSAADCADLFAGLNRRFPQVTNFAAIDRDGRFFASGRAFGPKGAPDGRSLPFFKALAAGRESLLMDPHPGPVSGQLVTGLAQRLEDDRRRFDGLVGVSFGFDYLASYWRETIRGVDPAVLIFDGAGKLIFDTRADVSGSRVYLADFGLRVDDSETRFTLDGVDQLGHLVRVGAYEWNVLAFAPAAPGFVGFVLRERGVLQLLAAFLLMLALSVFLLWRNRRATVMLVGSEQALRVQAEQLESMVRLRTQALAETGERLSLILNSAAEAIYGVDAHGLCTFANRTALDMLGYAQESDLVGRGMHETIHHSHDDGRLYPVAECPIYRGIREARNVNVRGEHFWRRDGSSFPVEYWAHRIVQDGKYLGSVVSFLGIGDQLRGERREAELAKVFEVLSDQFFRFAADGRILDHRAAAALRPAKNPVGLALAEVFPADVAQAIAAALVRAGVRQGPVAIEYELAGAGGERQYEMRVAPLEGNGDLLAVVRDISERKAGEAELARVAKALEAANAELERRVAERTAELEAANRELESFSYAISHDLRAPLRAIEGFSDALREDFGDRFDGEAQVYLEHLLAGSRRMRELVDGLLDLSRQTRGELQIAANDLGALAREIADELRRGEPERHVEFDIADGLVAFCDRRMVRSLLQNLIGNAWKFTARTAAAQIVVGGEVVVGNDGERRLVCRIGDNGAGFDMRSAARLFQPFQRLHKADEFPGSGIGLATVRRIVARHGGSIAIDSEPGRGTVVTFILKAEECHG